VRAVISESPFGLHGCGQSRPGGDARRSITYRVNSSPSRTPCVPCPSVLPVVKILRRPGEEAGAPLHKDDKVFINGLRDAEELFGAKKCGVESGDPNLRLQPRLPGSVVGEASMRQDEKADKITRVTVRR